MHVAVIGTGYVGLVAGACLAETGNDVVCADIDQSKIALLNGGEIPIYEPGLEELVERNLRSGRLRFTTDIPGAVIASDVIFIAVGTPPDEDGSADLQHVLEAARTIGRSMNGERIVITKSTVPVGTATKVRDAIEGETDHPVHVCSNPEFLKEGAAVADFMKPDRVVLGVSSEYAAEVMRDLYSPFVMNGNQILIMDIASAEITKYAANAMLATRISFMNTVAGLCEKTGADVDMVRRGIGSDARIGRSFLYPGVGYGGSCFPKDVKALIRTMDDIDADPSILQAVDDVNDRQKGLLLRQIVARLGTDLSGKKVAVWGLAFKPNTDDMREAPSIVTIEGLLERGASVAAHDPEAMDEAKRRFGDRIELGDDYYAALKGAACLVIHTEWSPYRRPDFVRMSEEMKEPIVFDGRNLYEPGRMADLGFEYHSIGRRSIPVLSAQG
jgi:UDPglucose 6-dehydrogenase